MSDGINQWVGAGNLAADPYQATGGPCVLRLAMTRSYTKDGEREEATDYVSVEVWGRRGDALAAMLRKGEAVTITGYLTTKTREHNGETIRELKVIGTNVVLRGKRSRDS